MALGDLQFPQIQAPSNDISDLILKAALAKQEQHDRFINSMDRIAGAAIGAKELQMRQQQIEAATTEARALASLRGAQQKFLEQRGTALTTEPDTFGQLLMSSGMPKEQVDTIVAGMKANKSLLPTTLAGQALGVVGKEQVQQMKNQNQKPVIKTQNIGGKMYSLALDPQTGKPVGNAFELGVSEDFARKYAELSGNYSQAKAVLDQAEDVTKKYLVNENYLITLGGGLNKKLESFINKPGFEDLKAYYDRQGEMSIYLSRLVAQGARGVATFVPLMRQALINPVTDTLNSALAKMNQSRNLADRAQAIAEKELLGQSLINPSIAPQRANYTQGFSPQQSPQQTQQQTINIGQTATLPNGNRVTWNGRSWK